MERVRLLFCLLLLLATCCEGKNQRKPLKVTNCTGQPPFSKVKATELYYNIVSTGSSCMHLAWSTESYPTLYAAYTGNISLCKCNASTYNNTHFTVPGVDSDFSVAVVFMGLFEFNATKKNFAAGGLNLTVACDYSNYTDWEDSNSDSNSYISLDDNVTWTFEPENMTFIGTYYDIPGNYVYKNRTRFSIRTSIPKVIGENRLKYFPRTLFYENSTTFDIISENYPFVNPNMSRLALKVLLIHGVNVRNGTIRVNKTVDDEYTPSIFSTYTYQTNVMESSNETRVGYIQWKPISYQDNGRKSTSSQQVTIVSADETEGCEVTKIPGESLASRIYGTDVSNITHWFVVFGTDGDPTYLSPNYNTWTASVGTGQVPTEGLSFVVYITIVVGLGIPACLVFVSAVYVFMKKKPWENVRRWVNSSRGYTRLS